MLHILDGDIHLIDLQTRMPFKYGIATMTRAPQAFVRIRLDVDGKESTGIAADLLPPKWFTKIADKPLEEEIDEMLSVIEHAVARCRNLKADSLYHLWRQISVVQNHWGREQNYPPLLSNFGTTLVERALIEALAKASGLSFSELVRTNRLGIRLNEYDERLRGCEPGDLLSSKTQTSVIARHTIGMADPLTDDDIAPDDRLDDGLPQSLVQCIKSYGLRHFKIKVSGDRDHDHDRLQRIAEIIAQHAPANFAFTMDGNEQFRSLESFREFWQTIAQQTKLRAFLEHLLFVEQPFHRDIALDADVLGGLSQWSDRPRLIIDESDAEADSLQRALGLGYHGTSHKNCKGVFRGIEHACLLEKLRRDDPQSTFIMSGEDLANIGPIALLQDLAVSASLGVESIERNGHHYFAGLSAFPENVQQQTLATHADLYRKSKSGWPTLNIADGRLDLSSVMAAPLGVGFELDVEQFTPSDEWRKSTGL